jgi:outer membrane protein assembly factor BamA
MHRLALYILISCLLCASNSNAQKRTNASVIAWPILFTTPETGIGGGVAGGMNFYLHQKDSIKHASQIQFGGVFTERSRYQAYVPFNLVLQNRKYQIYGEAGYYQYSLLFFGLGSEEIKKGIRYNTDIVRLRLHLLYRFSNHWFAGARWWYENMRLPVNTDNINELPSSIPGGHGSVMSGPGVVVMYDTRNHLYLPKHGGLLELSYHDQRAFWGSQFNWNRWRVEGRYFLTPMSWLTIASMAMVEQIDGNAPFLQWPGIGGSRRLRGFYEGRFRDRSAAVVNLEMRTRYWHRIGIAVFSGAALLAPQIEKIYSQKVHVASGVGFRWLLDQEKGITVRFDAAKGSDQWQFYFGIGESF